ncbi:hypothetical protein MTO96_049924 [Rhipicephalus appendiculatus]
MNTLKFATWNVRGFREKAKQRDVLRFAESQAIDLLFIQEANFRTPLDVVLRHLNLSDVWVHLYKDTFVPTRTSRNTASRIDRTYLPELLLSSVEACEVLALPDTLVGKTDHVPLVTTIRGTPGLRFSNTSWRVDPALLQDEESIEVITELLQASVERAGQITPPAWDGLKAKWKVLLQEEGKARKRRLTGEMKELLRRMKIVRGGREPYYLYEQLSRNPGREVQQTPDEKDKKA